MKIFEENGRVVVDLEDKEVEVSLPSGLAISDVFEGADEIRNGLFKCLSGQEIAINMKVE